VAGPARSVGTDSYDRSRAHQKRPRYWTTVHTERDPDQTDQRGELALDARVVRRAGPPAPHDIQNGKQAHDGAGEAVPITGY